MRANTAEVWAQSRLVAWYGDFQKYLFRFLPFPLCVLCLCAVPLWRTKGKGDKQTQTTMGWDGGAMEEAGTQCDTTRYDADTTPYRGKECSLG